MDTKLLRLILLMCLQALATTFCVSAPGIIPMVPTSTPGVTNSPTLISIPSNTPPPTLTALPTFQPLPSITIAPSSTPPPSFTPAASFTPVKTRTPTQPPTRTRTPTKTPTRTTVPTITPHPTLTTSLKKQATLRGIKIGVALLKQPLASDPNYRPALLSQFNLVTINQFQMQIIQPGRDEFDFSATDELVDFAHRRKLDIRAYALLSPDVPDWLKNGNFNEQQARNILRTHITTVVKRYKGRVGSWVVVAQAMNSNGTLRNTYWLKTIGPEYINLAFQWAKQADPGASFYYADNGLESSGKKNDAVLALLKGLRTKKIAVKGLEIQLNLDLANIPTPAQLTGILRKYAQAGFDIHLTEVAVRIRKPVTEEKLLKQGDKYQRLMLACLAVTRCKAFTLWGFTDAYYMFPGLYPDHTDAFIFDKNYLPKPAYFGLYQALITP